MSAVKKAVKSVGRFVKKHWKKIVIAAAIVFTAGLATVGTSGFAASMSSATAAGASGMGAALSAAGSTMVAGVQAIGGAFGIGQGVNMANFGGVGQATLGTGAAAQAMGMGANAGVQTAAQVNAAATAAAPSAALGGGPPSTLAGTGTQAATTAGTTAADTVRSAASNLGATTQQAANAQGQTGIMRTLMGGGQWMGPVMQGLTGYMQSRAMAEAADAQDPLGYWGISPSGEDRDLTPEEIASGGLMAQTDPYFWRRQQQEQAEQRNLPAPGAAGGGMA